jgi:hypothetical protein
VDRLLGREMNDPRNPTNEHEQEVSNAKLRNAKCEWQCEMKNGKWKINPP